MRPSTTTTTTLLAIPLLLTSFAYGYNLDCSHIRVSNKKFDLSKLAGPHSVTVEDKSTPPSIRNTTYTIDICATLKKDPDIKNELQCESGTNVCGITTVWNPINDPDQKNAQIENVIPIAGSLTSSGSALDPQVTRLKATDSQAEGLQIELNGGSYAKKKQRAVVQFICDRNRTGNEGSKFDKEKNNSLQRRADDDSDKKADDENRSLSYVSYGEVEGKETMMVLRLDWKTKYACEDFEDDDDDTKKKAGWGFFTWFILIAFLGIAAYLIFGSWLNYNRYGARGWDLLPHGDTIRDVPYLFKDWSRKVVDTVSGSGSRGGYSAV